VKKGEATQATFKSPIIKVRGDKIEKFKGMTAKPGKKPAFFLLDLFLDPEDGRWCVHLKC
jgi:hypothetical protein